MSHLHDKPADPHLQGMLFRSIIDNTEAVVFVKDREGRYIYTNLHHQKIFQLSPNDIWGKTDLQVFPRKIALKFRRNDALVLRFGKTVSQEESAPVDGEMRTWISLKYPLRDPKGRMSGVCGIATDITQQKRAEKALRDSEERFRLFSQSARDYALAILDPKGRIMTWDAASVRIRGFKSEEVLGKYFGLLFRPTDRRDGLPEKILKRLGKESRIESEGWRQRKDGSAYWIRQNLCVLKDSAGRIRGYASVAHDMTEQKRIEKEAKASRSLMEAEEKERRRIARDLHDGLSQILSTAKHRILRIEPTEGRSAATQKRQLSDVAQILDLAIGETRRITRNLRPTVLDDLGLLPAVRSLFDDIRKSAGLACRVVARGSMRRVSKPLEVTLYRLIQEAAMNVARHARATRLTIRIVLSRRLLIATVEDNGRGFRISRIGNGHGLANMRERTELAGGQFSVRTRPGTGTMLRMEIPL